MLEWKDAIPSCTLHLCSDPAPPLYPALSLERMLSCLKKEMENGSSICLPWWLQLTGWAYLHSRLLWVWLPLTAPTADKRGNIKENRRAAELRHQCFFSSSHPPPPPATTISPSQTTAPSVASLFFPLHRRFRAVRRGMWHHKNSPEVSWLVTSTAACLVSGFPQGKLWSGPCLCTSRLLKGKRKKIFNRMFLHLVNWQNSFLEPCLGKQICGRVSDWQWGEFGMWKQDELLSLDKESELQHCFAWDSRKASKVWSRNKHAGLSV